jgi:hypothetical protein
MFTTTPILPASLTTRTAIPRPPLGTPGVAPVGSSIVTTLFARLRQAAPRPTAPAMPMSGPAAMSLSVAAASASADKARKRAAGGSY